MRPQLSVLCLLEASYVCLITATSELRVLLLEGLLLLLLLLLLVLLGDGLLDLGDLRVGDELPARDRLRVALVSLDRVEFHLLLYESLLGHGRQTNRFE